MADDHTQPAPPPAPAPNPNPAPARPALSNWVLIPLLAACAVAGFAAVHFYLKPSPSSDVVPKVSVTGVFWTRQLPGMRAEPGQPIGMIKIDATRSISTRPIRYRLRGAQSDTITTYTPDGSPASSVAEITVYEPGQHDVHVIAQGVVKGQPELDFDVFSQQVGPPPTPPPPPPPPGPTPPPDPPKPPPRPPLPGPGPLPNPPGPNPFPSTAIYQGGEHVG